MTNSEAEHSGLAGHFTARPAGLVGTVLILTARSENRREVN